MSPHPKDSPVRAAFLSPVLGLALALLPGLTFGADAHGGGEPPQVLVPPNVWGIVSFLLVFAIVVWKILPTIVHAMDKRAESIQASLEAAEQARAERQALMASHAAEAQRAREETAAILEEGKADAVRLRDSMIADARRTAQDLSDKAKREIQLAKQAAVDELQRRAVDLAFDLAARLVQKSLNPAEHEALVQDRIRNQPDA